MRFLTGLLAIGFLFSTASSAQVVSIGFQEKEVNAEAQTAESSIRPEGSNSEGQLFSQTPSQRYRDVVEAEILVLNSLANYIEVVVPALVDQGFLAPCEAQLVSAKAFRAFTSFEGDYSPFASAAQKSALTAANQRVSALRVEIQSFECLPEGETSDLERWESFSTAYQAAMTAANQGLIDHCDAFQLLDGLGSMMESLAILETHVSAEAQTAAINLNDLNQNPDFDCLNTGDKNRCCKQFSHVDACVAVADKKKRCKMSRMDFECHPNASTC
ncbi:MAG: hypothetical protein EA369_09015 [Bradymonadales bacterium]|nr:MAG: hypothetical protein EA369_09015 [Bradymonadales bacterium]